MRAVVAKSLQRKVDMWAQQTAIHEAKEKHPWIFWFFQRLAKWLIEPVTLERKKFMKRMFKRQYVTNKGKKA